MKLLLKLFLNAVAVIILANILSGIEVNSYWTAIIVAVVISLLNLIVKPILVILTLPITVITLGLFLLIVNAIIILLADGLIGGFEVQNFWWAILFSILLSILQSILHTVLKADKN